MKPPRDIRRTLAGEFHLAAEQMAAAPDLGQKLYFFSVFSAEAQRAFNRWWDADLVLLHQVTQTAYQNMSERVRQVASGADRVIGIPAELPDALVAVSNELAGTFDAAEIDVAALHSALARIAELSYSTTGNGHYLWLKGELKV